MDPSNEEAIIARLTNQNKSFRAGCKKCGYPGHLTFECRNFIRVDSSKDVVLDISSTSSEEDDVLELPYNKDTSKKAQKKVKTKKSKKRHKYSSSNSDDNENLKRDKKQKKRKRKYNLSEVSSSDEKAKKKKSKKRKKHKKHKSESTDS